MEELKMTQKNLAEQKVLTEWVHGELTLPGSVLLTYRFVSAHAYTEKQLNNMAGGLVSTLRASVTDLTGLYEKLGEGLYCLCFVGRNI